MFEPSSLRVKLSRSSYGIQGEKQINRIDMEFVTHRQKRTQEQGKERKEKEK
jgi:hypothetical protein